MAVAAAAWRRRRRRQAAGPDAEQLFTSVGCAGCHALAAAGATAKIGPDLGKLGDVDAEFIRTSIVDPSAEIQKGFTTA